MMSNKPIGRSKSMDTCTYKKIYTIGNYYTILTANRNNKQLLPTPVSPISTNLNKKS